MDHLTDLNGMESFLTIGIPPPDNGQSEIPSVSHKNLVSYDDVPLTQEPVTEPLRLKRKSAISTNDGIEPTCSSSGLQDLFRDVDSLRDLFNSFNSEGSSDEHSDVETMTSSHSVPDATNRPSESHDVHEAPIVFTPVADHQLVTSDPSIQCKSVHCLAMPMTSSPTDCTKDLDDGAVIASNSLPLPSEEMTLPNRESIVSNRVLESPLPQPVIEDNIPESRVGRASRSSHHSTRSSEQPTLVPQANLQSKHQGSNTNEFNALGPSPIATNTHTWPPSHDELKGQQRVQCWAGFTHFLAQWCCCCC
ncbi:hypothetical protein QCA50_019184 [Cerrena zonata]|uniref:Uncharacterized protein n=1 Tax=Cerrena zonata TaxID=2478898 RepID=A0AAW0FCV7_9APHY